MSKPIQETIFKSRLTISYRTNITGTSQQEHLPFRVLVLGDFEGRAKRGAELLSDISKRSVRSIKRGTSVDDHLAEVVPMWRIPSQGALADLQSFIPGTAVCEQLQCSIPRGSIDRKESGAFPLSGSAVFQSHREQNGLGTIDGRLAVSGTMEVEFDAGGIAKSKKPTIRLSGMVTGDYIDLATERKVGVITGLVTGAQPPITAAGIKTFEAAVDAGADTGRDSKIQVFSVVLAAPLPVIAERTMPFTSLRDFSPDAVAASIPQLHRLRVLKQLLSELQSELRNRPELRKQVKALLPGYGEKQDQIKDKISGFTELRAWAKAKFEIFEIGV